LCDWKRYQKLGWYGILILLLVLYFSYTIMVSLDMEGKKYLIREGLRNREGIYTNIKRINSKHIVRPLRKRINHHLGVLKGHFRNLRNKLI
jgi:hypothetical protein